MASDELVIVPTKVVDSIEAGILWLRNHPALESRS